MSTDIDLHILKMNFVEFLTSFIEGRVTLPMIFELNERIYNRDHTTLSQSLIAATTALHNLKQRIDHGENIDKETIIFNIDDIILDLLNN